MKNETEKATARPWETRNWDSCISIDGPDCAGIAFVNPLKTHPTDQQGAIPSAKDRANAALIVEAVNQHEALKAVAKRAAEIEEQLQKVNFSKPTFVQVDRLNGLRIWLREALANLAAVQKQ